jgi:hypothetical protein
MILVLDDVMTEEYCTSLENLPYWLKFYYMDTTSYPTEQFPVVYTDENVKDIGQLSSPLYILNEHKESCYDIITPFLYVIKQKVQQIKFNNEIRVKYNILVRNADSTPSNYNTPHHDAVSNAYSIVYYCNDSDGDTFLFNEFYEGKNPDKLTIAQRVTPKKNRCVIFESNRMHASSSPIYSKDRRVINFVIDAHESD